MSLFECQCGQRLPLAVITWPLYCACGRVYKSADDNPTPGIKRRLSNYAKARNRWVAAGKPVVTDEVRAERLSICQGCEWYDGKICTHKKCGCSISARERFWGDKLRWATESCPVGKWQEVTSEPAPERTLDRLGST